MGSRLHTHTQKWGKKRPRDKLTQAGLEAGESVSVCFALQLDYMATDGICAYMADSTSDYVYAL